MTTVLIGPRTRLGLELAKQVKGQVLAVARDADDARSIRALAPLAGVEVADGSAGELTPRLAAGEGPVHLVVAALGPVHPGRPRASYDGPTVLRDLGFVEQVLAAGRPTRIIHVSTVLALAPAEDRRYYGGWKDVVEQQLQQLADDRCTAGGDATLSVLYPGRLLDASERRGLLRLHTSYAQLARVVVTTTAGPPVERAVGIDTRIWLLKTSISFALRSLRLRSRRSSTPSPSAGVMDRGLSGEGG